MKSRFTYKLGSSLLSAAVVALLSTAAMAQTLTIGVKGGPTSIDPHYSAAGPHAEAAKHIFDTLVWSDEKLQPQPGLAESWVSIEPTVWEFKLRKGVKFHDGSDFTAEDVRFSIERIPHLNAPAPLTLYTKHVKETQIIDPHTIRIVTHSPAPALPNDFVRLFIVSHKAAADLNAETANAAFNSGDAAIGTGPFKFVKWTPTEELVLERNPDYWRGASSWERVIRREIPNDTARVAQFKAGQLDVISRVPAADISVLKNDTKFEVTIGDTVYIFYLELDARDQTPQLTAKDGSPLAKNPFQDKRVREAVSLAFDRAALADIAQEGLGAPLTQIVTSNIFGYNDELPELKQDAEKARALLEEAGYADGFKVVFNFTNDRFPGDRAIGTSISQALARIGIDATANGQPGATLFPARLRGEYSFAMSTWGTLTGEAHYTLSSIAHSNDPDLRLGIHNWRGYKNDAVDAALTNASKELDNDKRLSFLKQAGFEFANDFSVIPVTSVRSAWAYDKQKVTVLRLRADDDTLAQDIEPAKN